MKKTILAAGAAVLTLFSVGVAMAGDAATGRGPHGDETRAALIQTLDARFAELDTNRDGTITAAERQTQHQVRRDAMFARMDADGNGSISRAEFAAMKPEGGRGGHHGRGGGHGRMGMGMGMGQSDGAVTKAAFQARALARFDRLDTDRNGVVTQAERKAGWQAHGKRR